MTKAECDIVLNGVKDIVSDNTTAMLEKITSLENRLQAAENRLNQGVPNNTAPAGQAGTAKDYPY